MKGIGREISRLAIPAIISNITTPLLGLADTAVTGRMGAASYIGAIAVGGGMLSMAYWLLGFLRMGTSGLTAQAYGSTISGSQSISAECASVLWRGLAVATVASVLLMAASPWIAKLLLWFMGADGMTSALARTYFIIVIFGAPAVLGVYALSGWFLGMQDSKGPMWMALLTNLLNIPLSVTLVFGFGMKIEGVAIGTLAAQWAGFALGLAIAHRKFGLFTSLREGGSRLLSGLSLREIFDGKEIRKFFTVNLFIFLRTCCLAFVTLWFTRSGARQGADLLAANALLMQLFILFSYFMDGFAFAGEAMAGKYYGRHDSGMLRATVKGVFYCGAVLAAIFTLVYAIGAKEILFLLTDDEEVVSQALTYLPWVLAIPAAGVAAFVWDGIFIGLSMTRSMFVSMAIATGVFFILYFLFTPALHNHGLWLSFIAYLLTRGLIQSLLYRPTPKLHVF